MWIPSHNTGRPSRATTTRSVNIMLLAVRFLGHSPPLLNGLILRLSTCRTSMSSSTFATAVLVRENWRTASLGTATQTKRFLPKYVEMRASLSSLKPPSFPLASTTFQDPLPCPLKDTELRMQFNSRERARRAHSHRFSTTGRATMLCLDQRQSIHQGLPTEPLLCVPKLKAFPSFCTKLSRMKAFYNCRIKYKIPKHETSPPSHTMPKM